MRTTLPQLAMTNDNDLTQSKCQAQQCVPAQWSVHLTTCMQTCIGMVYRVRPVSEHVAKAAFESRNP